MNFSNFNKRVSFQVKVLVPVIAIMGLLTGVTIWLVNGRISEQLQASAAEDLGTAAKLIRKIQQNRADELLAKYRNIINEPRFKAVTRGTDFPTVKKYLDDFMQELVSGQEAEVAAFTFLQDGQARVISASNDPRFKIAEFQIGAAEAVRRAAAGKAAVDTIRVGGELFNIVAFPVSAGEEPAGVLSYGVKLDAREAREIKQITGSEIVFLTDGQMAASSLPKGKLSPEEVARLGELSGNEAAVDAHRSKAITLDGEYFLCQSGRFHSLTGDPRLGYLLLSSQAKPLAEFRATQQLLLAVCLLGMVLSTLVIWIVIRKITQPLRELRDNAEAVGRGDFSRRAAVVSNDECGELAVAFNQMTENVKTSREELEKTVETLKATQNQLIQSEKLSGIGEFVAGVAHELNNPLTSVMGFSELLQQGDMPEQQRRYLDVIFKSAKRCTKIVQSLLSFARRHAPERKVVCVNEIVESAVEILRYQMRTSNIEVTTQFDPRLPATEIDPHQMQQVFLNIINNARQAMEGRTGQGLLRITTECAGGRVRIKFKDNGPGIAPENLKRIFNPFFTTKEVGKGTGLGLSLCYGIVSEHGGTITPESILGDGAAFIIELPVANARPQPVEKSAAPAPEAGAAEGVGKRVLVIDDEDLILQMIKEILTRNGYKVDVALDGETALRRLGQYHYDLALCDWKMPGLNGQEVFERLQASNPEMSRRFVFITGDVVNEKVQEFLKLRDKICLSKPFSLGEFRSAISRVITP